MLALVGNLVFKFYNKVQSLESEREWYVSQLAYNFSATVDTVIFLDGNVGPGRLFCAVTDGSARAGVEDSLMHQLKHFTELRFNESKNDDTLIFVVPGADRWKANDKILVNTLANELKIFREDVLIYEDKVSNLLEGRLIKTYD
jgi:hypothetical protein